MEISDQKTKDAFMKYVNLHPEQRFWQSIRNFFEADMVAIGTFIQDKEGNYKPGEYRDTFYIEADKEWSYGQDDQYNRQRL